MRFFGSWLALIALTSCVRIPPSFTTPSPYDPSANVTYPLEIEFSLLGPATAKVCMENAFRARPDEQFDELHPQARYKAIESIAGADNIMYERTKMERTNEQVCVTVSGHAYAIKSLHAHPGELPPNLGPLGIPMKLP